MPQLLIKQDVMSAATHQIDPADHQWYLNRELSWLSFKRRVLHEAEDERVPLLERLKFIAIVSDNNDVFFMKRIGGLKQQIGAGMREVAPDGRTPRQQVQECYSVVREIEAYKDNLLRQVIELLRQKDLNIKCYTDLSNKEKIQAREVYQANIFPLLFPQSISLTNHFPFVTNLSLNLLVKLRNSKTKKTSLSLVTVPGGQGIPRFIRVDAGDSFVRMEDVIRHNLDTLYPGKQIESCELFRVTRNANTEKNEEEADDLIVIIESELKERKFAPIVRLEVEKGISQEHLGILTDALHLHEEQDVFEVQTMFAMSDLFEIACLEYPRMHYPPHQPIDHHLLQSARNIFHIIRDSGSILLQHPYESFTSSVDRFLREAAADPKVRCIKMILYRTSINSSIIDSLVHAANNGKQVAVVIELKARFDEEVNIHLAEKLEEVGIHVSFGMVDLKTSCKVILIVRQDYYGLRRYVHIGTGNYQAEKSREFTDIGTLTCDDDIGQDASELFNYLTTGFNVSRQYTKMILSPFFLKKSILMKIERETALHTAHDGGHIRFKMNSLEDTDIIEALYKASMAGVRVDLIVRGICRLRPGLPGLSERIRVTSIVGRFMEHSRIYYFRNNGQDEYFIGSADLVKRNLEARVDVLVPVESPELKQELRKIFEIHEHDYLLAWEMQPDGTYVQRMPTIGEKNVGSHQMLISIAEQRSKANLKEKRIWRP